MCSPKLKQVAYEVRTGQESSYFRPQKGRPVASYLPRSDRGWFSSWGVRIVWDEEGHPALISFGQWALPWRSDPKRRSRAIEHACLQASSLSKAYLADFLAANIAVEDLSKTGFKEVRQRGIQEGSIEEIINAVIDVIHSKAKRIARVRNLSGVGPLKRKLLFPQIGDRRFIQCVVATAYTWENARAARGLRSWKPSSPQGTEGVHSESGQSYRSGVIESPDTTEIYDW